LLGEETGLTDEERAFYDALAENQIASSPCTDAYPVGKFLTL